MGRWSVVGLAVLCAASLAMAQTQPPPAPAEPAPIRTGDAIRLSTDEWRCISARLDRFAGSTSERIIIPVVACPAAPTETDAAAAPAETTNLSLDFRASSRTGKRAYRGLLIVNRDELDCLVTLAKPPARPATAPALATKKKEAGAIEGVILDLASPRCAATDAEK